MCITTHVQSFNLMAWSQLRVLLSISRVCSSTHNVIKVDHQCVHVGFLHYYTSSINCQNILYTSRWHWNGAKAKIHPSVSPGHHTQPVHCTHTRMTDIESVVLSLKFLSPPPPSPLLSADHHTGPPSGDALPLHCLAWPWCSTVLCLHPSLHPPGREAGLQWQLRTSHSALQVRGWEGRGEGKRQEMYTLIV